MSNSTIDDLVKKRKKAAVGKLKLATGLREDISRNVTLHDLFTIALVIITIIVMLLF